jgi:hypothetical protein
MDAVPAGKRSQPGFNGCAAAMNLVSKYSTPFRGCAKLKPLKPAGIVVRTLELMLMVAGVGLADWAATGHAVQPIAIIAARNEHAHFD